MRSAVSKAHYGVGVREHGVQRRKIPIPVIDHRKVDPLVAVFGDHHVINQLKRPAPQPYGPWLQTTDRPAVHIPAGCPAGNIAS